MWRNYRPRLLAASFGCLLIAALLGPAWGQSAYPTKPVNILISFSPGGVVDISTRALTAKAEKILGQPFVLSNNGGGGGAVAAAIVSTQKPDGYNLLSCTSTTLIRIPQYRTVPYSLDDFVPIMQHASTESGLAVRADSPFKTLKDLVNYARKNPGKVTYSTLGIGSPMHLSMEFIAKQEGVTWTHVPYLGSMPSGHRAARGPRDSHLGKHGMEAIRPGWNPPFARHPWLKADANVPQCTNTEGTRL